MRLKMRRARIVCTIGPASGDEKRITRMIRAGMNIARLNFSHGSHEEHLRYIKMVREASETLGMPVGILQDLQGIKIRIGDLPEGEIHLRTGDHVLVRPGAGPSTMKEIHINYPALLRDVKKGDRVLLDDGLMELRVTGRRKDALQAVVKEGGVLRSRKGVNLPDSKISLSPFTDKDRKDLAFGIANGVDMVALSFVLKASDIKTVKDWLHEQGREIPVIAKIEKPEALEDMERILQVADGIMVARGDLGVEIPPEKVPMVQKMLIRKANRAGRMVIIATQMLESMREHMRPTRAEATDVANAVVDGTDALMLSAETSSGRYPLKSVKMMDRIIRETEKITLSELVGTKRELPIVEPDEREALAVVDAAVRAAEDLPVRYIIAFTRTGFTARILSKLRPTLPVIAFTPEEDVYRRLSLCWGVIPMLTEPVSSTDRMLRLVEDILIEKAMVREGDRMIILASSPMDLFGKTNFMKVHRCGGGS